MSWIKVSPKVFVPLIFFGFLETVLYCFPIKGLTQECFQFQKNDKGYVILTNQGQAVWEYHPKMEVNKQVPEKDPRRLAGCFFHPLYGLNGEILTDNAPKDHYHHHGIFWTWPHVTITRPNGNVENYDLWTSDSRLKQEFINFGEQRKSRDSAVFEVHNGWFIAPETNQFEYNPQGQIVSEKIMDEFVRVTTYPVQKKNNMRTRAIDFDLTWTVGTCLITLRGAEQKSYGGLTIRFRPSERKAGGKSVITIPKGIVSEDLPEIPLPWSDYTSCFMRNSSGKPIDKQTGAAIFVSADHPDYPPTWLLRYYGPLCVGWPGVSGKTFQPGETFKLSYRIWIHDQPVSAEVIQAAYQDYLTENKHGNQAVSGKTQEENL